MNEDKNEQTVEHMVYEHNWEQRVYRDPFQPILQVNAKVSLEI